MNKPVLLALLAAAPAAPAAAQTTPPPVYLYVEQMPVLPGNTSQGAIKSAIENQLRLPAADVQRRTYGRILVAFVVTETGAVASPHIVKGLTATADAAALQAVRQLPRFTPGRQQGRAVSVALTIPVEVGKKFAAQAAAAAAERDARTAPDLSDLSGEGSRPTELVDSDKVYTYVEQMPALPGGGGQAAVVDALWHRFKYPAPDVRNKVEGRVFVKFTVNAVGRPEDIQVVKGLTSTIDAATIEAVKSLPTFTPGRQNNQIVKVSLTVPLSLSLPRR